MAGTLATYQGFALTECTFTRTRGYGSSASTVEIMAPATGFSVAPATLDTQYQRTAPPEQRLERLASTAPSARAGLPTSLGPSGYLVMAEEDPAGRRYVVTVGPLYVIRAETVRRDDVGAVQFVRVTLADVRFFWPRGVLPRWSFNRVRADGTLALDSSKGTEDVKRFGGKVGDLFSKHEIARVVVSSLPGKPDLVAAPDRWKLDRAAVEFPRFGAAVRAAATLADKGGLEDPCLRIDGTVALAAAGEGTLGYAPEGSGANSQSFPASVVLYKEGRGRGQVLEPGWPEEFVIVAGGERVSTVSVDDWEPVLVLPGHRIVPLDEEHVRLLTDGAFGIEWLRKFVLRPTAYQGNPKLDPEVADLLADQAWRMWRLPGAEVVTRADDGGTVSNPGRNAHLLPLRPRAETVNGRRIQPTVHCYHFTTEHVQLRGSPQKIALAELVRQVAKLRASAPARPRFRGVVNPLLPLTVGDVLRGADAAVATSRGVSVGELQSALDRVRAVESYREGTSGPAMSAGAFTDELLRLTRAQIGAEEAAGGPAGRTAIWDAARAIFEVEASLKKEAGLLESGKSSRVADLLASREDARAALLSRLETLLTEVENARDKQRREKITGTGGGGEAFGLVVLSNRPKRGTRKEDVGARVVDAEAGLVRTSDLAGHVSPDGAADPLDAVFIPRPVKVLFGAVVRPRLDVAPGVARRVETLSALGGPNVGGENVIPETLSDQGAYYAAAFKRAARGVPVRVPLDQVSFDRAITISEPDLVELVPLDGRSNSADLDQRAAQLVAERMNAPDKVETQRLVLARPWPVQCDGVVASVKIVMRKAPNGAPCGFETHVVTGSTAAAVAYQGATRERPRVPKGGDGARRTGATL